MVSALEARRLPSINIQIDYSHDTSNFFDTPEKRDLMQAAADVVASGLGNDHLTAIVPSAGDGWMARFPDPATGAEETIANLTVPADTIIIYVGGRTAPSVGEAGSGSTGGFDATGDPAWLANVAARGHDGALAATPSSFGPWGGSIGFDTTATHWFFGNSTAGLTADETDFFTVAEHEIGHVLGLGTSGSWFSHVSGDVFTGPAAMAVHGGPVPLGPDHEHWADGTRSYGAGAVMDPMLDGGTRLMFTDLDFAGLADVGWSVQLPSQVATVQFAKASYRVAANLKTATILVNRSGSLGAFTVNYATSDGTARAGVDYQATAGTLGFGITDTSASITVPILASAKRSGSEVLTLTLSSPGAGVALGAQSSVMLTIENNGLQPAADFDGDGRSDLGVFRPATSQWFVQPSGNGPWNPISFGGADLLDIPVPADYDGVGHAEPAVFRPSTGQWFIAGHAQPISFGATNLLDIPVPGDYDGVGHAEFAVFRPSTAQWFIAGHAQPIVFGAPNFSDLPLEAPIGSLLELGLIGSQSATAHPATDGTIGASLAPATPGANIPVAPAHTPEEVSGLAPHHKKTHHRKSRAGIRG